MGKTRRLFGRCVRSAIKVLCRVRDSYVRRLTELSSSVQYETAMGYGSFTACYGFPMEREFLGYERDFPAVHGIAGKSEG